MYVIVISILTISYKHIISWSPKVNSWKTITFRNFASLRILNKVTDPFRGWLVATINYEENNVDFVACKVTSLIIMVLQYCTYNTQNIMRNIKTCRNREICRT